MSAPGTPDSRESPLLEVIVLSLDDAREAERGAAGRLEVVRDLGREGLTPAFELVEAIAEAVAVPVRVMLREREPFDGHRLEDLDALSAAAARFAGLGVEGFVTGFLRGGAIDLDAVTRVLARVGSARVTFHRAFEAASDTRAALTALRGDPRIDRLLATGGTGDWPERAVRLDRLAREAAPWLQPVAAAGVDEAAIVYLRAHTRLVEFHVGRAARVGGRVDAPVSARRVEALVRAMRASA